MNPFVEECRREWKRLGVPDAVANEMAADLSVDLAEAEADGTSAEEVLGTGVFDAPAFAAAWAAERGVITVAAAERADAHATVARAVRDRGLRARRSRRPGAGAPAAADRLGAPWPSGRPSTRGPCHGSSSTGCRSPGRDASSSRP